MVRDNLCFDFYERDFFEFVEGERDIVFMNHGYYPEDDAEPLALQSDDALWPHQVRMYHTLVSRALGGQPAAGLSLLDVGSGRGGGPAFLSRHFDFGRVVGLEISPRQVAFARERHGSGGGGLSFAQGSALALPFEDGSFDLVTNVESMHCYPDVRRFYDEVRRVLRPGGRFVCADIFEGPPRRGLQEAMEDRFLVHSRRDITERVALACLADSTRFRQDLAGRATPETIAYLIHLFRSKFLVYHDRENEYHEFVLERAHLD